MRLKTNKQTTIAQKVDFNIWRRRRRRRRRRKKKGTTKI